MAFHNKAPIFPAEKPWNALTGFLNMTAAVFMVYLYLCVCVYGVYVFFDL